ncbi:MAG: hypothetical protein CFE45_00215 [Burkholderiales bacterium PBB5]|nr:MAG: hypothetical protein CFE45_00215 [Burkholderiales bacterium PBB5]
MLLGCASPVTVMPLATGQVQVQAFELRGTDSQTLRQEAARLCAGAGDVLRESAASRQPPPPDGRVALWGRWLGDAVMPSERHAQLVVRCAPQPDRRHLSAAGAQPGGAAAFTGSSAMSDRDVPYGY